MIMWEIESWAVRGFREIEIVLGVGESIGSRECYSRG